MEQAVAVRRRDVIVGILPDIASSLQVSEVDVGNLVALFAVVYAPLTPFGSAYIARFRRFRAHLVLMGVFLVGNVLCASPWATRCLWSAGSS